MSDKFRFLNLVEAVLNAAGQDGRQLTAEGKEVYSFHSEGISIDLAGNQQGFINLFAFVDEFEMLSYPAIMTLLLQNSYQEEYPAISYSVLMLESGKSRISLWLRFRLDAVTPVEVTAAFERLLSTAIQIQQWLEAEFAADADALQPKVSGLSPTAGSASAS